METPVAKPLAIIPIDISASAARMIRRRPMRSASGAMPMPPIAMPISPALNRLPIVSDPMPQSDWSRGAMNDRIVTSTPSAMLMAKHRATTARPERVHCAGPGPAPSLMGAAISSLSQIRTG